MNNVRIVTQLQVYACTNCEHLRCKRGVYTCAKETRTFEQLTPLAARTVCDLWADDGSINHESHRFNLLHEEWAGWLDEQHNQGENIM